MSHAGDAPDPVDHQRRHPQKRQDAGHGLDLGSHGPAGARAAYPEQIERGALHMSTREDAVAKLKKQIDDVNAQISEIEAKAEEVGAKSRDDFDRQMDQLRDHARQMQSKLEEMRGAGEDAWDRIIEESRKLRDAFVHSYNYFKSQMK
jgi:chromosome segregation ATPase